MESKSIFNRKKRLRLQLVKKFISKGIKGYHLVFPPPMFLFMCHYNIACLEALHMIKTLTISQNRLNVTK